MLASERSSPPNQIGRSRMRSLTTIRYSWPLRTAISSMPITVGAGTPALASCARMYCLSSSFTVCQSSFSSLATSYIGYRSAATAPADVEGKSLGVERVVRQELETLALHLAAPAATHAPHLELQEDAQAA